MGVWVWAACGCTVVLGVCGCVGVGGRAGQRGCGAWVRVYRGAGVGVAVFSWVYGCVIVCFFLSSTTRGTTQFTLVTAHHHDPIPPKPYGDFFRFV